LALLTWYLREQSMKARRESQARAELEQQVRQPSAELASRNADLQTLNERLAAWVSISGADLPAEDILAMTQHFGELLERGSVVIDGTFGDALELAGEPGRLSQAARG
jgi:hypothetical protein